MTNIEVGIGLYSYNHIKKIAKIVIVMGGYGCDICDMTFNSPSDLDSHLREKHNIDIA